MHILITGGVGVGKSTLIHKLLQQTQAAVYGFRTKKAEADASGDAKVYIHAATGALTYEDGNVVGLSSPKGGQAYPEVFDNVGLDLLSEIPAGAIVLMDELGFMESQAGLFCEKVMDILDGPYYVIAAVKTMSTPFLDAVRSHEKGLIWTITPENRDGLYDAIMLELAVRDPESPFLG